MGCPSTLASGLLSPYTGMTGSLISPYYDIIFLVAMLMGFYIALKYAAGKFFTNTGWEAAALVDLSDLWKSLIAIGLAVGFFEATRAISCTLAGNSDPVQIAIEFLNKIMLKGIIEAINDVFTIQVAYSIFNTFSFRPHEAVWTWTFKIAPAADSVVNIMSMIGYGLVAVFGSVSAQITILTIINATMFQFFLPAGIILRFFPPTRDAGNFLIAFAIGFQVIFPMTYVLDKMALDNIWILTGRGSEYTPYIGSAAIGIWKWTFIGGAFPVALLGSFMQQSAGGVLNAFGLSGFAQSTITAISVSTMEFTAYNFTFALLRPILEALADLSLVSLFLPAFSTMVTFAFINAMTKFAQTKA